MKISYNWLKQYVDVKLPAEEVGKILTATGLEVEEIVEVESIRGGLKGVVTGRVISCEKHPNADKLSLTKVDVGQAEPLPIVCGAPNVALNQKVLVATVGSTLYIGDKSIEIKKAKIRGEHSEGMICAEDELGLSDAHDGIMVLPDDVEPGQPAADYFEVENDTVFEIGLTPNRSDATSHLGVARDLVAALNFQCGESKYQLRRPNLDHFSIDDHALEIPVEVEDTAACPRYSGITLTRLKVGPSPEWMQNKLKAIGVRPINNIVDITNYVLFETGQPLHAFDAQHIDGNKIIVKKLPENTPFVTLDEVERKLHATDLMICNASEPMCIGGVFGGLKSGVTETTTAIFLESACFEATGIRRTAKRHGLQTDASFRFERGSDPDMTVYALKRAALLMKELAGAHISSGIQDVYPEPVQPFNIRFEFDYLYTLGGHHIAAEQVVAILKDLEIRVQARDDKGLNLLVPVFKTDVKRPADIVEEVLRIYGYDRIPIPEKLNASLNPLHGPDNDRLQNKVSDMLSAKGFYEIMNNSLSRSAYHEKFSFLDESKQIKMLNPLSSDLDVLRQTLLTGGLESLAYNQNRKSSDLRFYEFGHIYQFLKNRAKPDDALSAYFEEKHLDLWLMGNKYPESWNRKTEPLDFFDLKHAVETVLQTLNINTDACQTSTIEDDPYEYGLSYHYNGKLIGRAGKLKQELCRQFDLKKEVFHAQLLWDALTGISATDEIVYRPVPKYPAVRRDLALVIDKTVAYADLQKAALKTAPELLVSMNLFDVYEGDKIPADKKSYAISFILLDKEKTLTDKRIEKTMDKLLKSFEKEFNAKLR